MAQEENEEFSKKDLPYAQRLRILCAMKGGMTKIATNLTLPKHVKKAAQRHCAETGVTLSWLTEKLVEKHLIKHGHMTKSGRVAVKKGAK